MKIGVSDTGIGIAPENLEHIFEEFYQVEDVPRNELNGTGLGLSLSRQFVRLHEGTMAGRQRGYPRPGQHVYRPAAAVRTAGREYICPNTASRTT